MSNGAYAGLRLAARAKGPDPESNPNEIEPDEDEDDASSKDGKKKEPKMSDTNTDAAASAARAEGFAEANARFNTVLASDQFAGREALAKSMLANDKLSADEIITMLAAAPKIEASPLASFDGGDANALAAMQAALAETGNSNIDANTTTTTASADDSAGVWDRVLAAKFGAQAK